MTNSASGPATSPAGPQGRKRCEYCAAEHYSHECPNLAERDPLHRGLFLADLLSELAMMRHHATTTYADAFLNATGTDSQRTQAAKLATADAHLAAELSAARVAAYRYIIGEGANNAN